MGGENVFSLFFTLSLLGSSPRGRGKPYAREAGLPRGRLIPAWAGKTVLCFLPSLYLSAHPRVGGENFYHFFSGFYLLGSSPRGRGKPTAQEQRPNQVGLIPAWAGKTGSRRGPPQHIRAHPRVGGENARRRARAVVASGSSPRGRGKPGGSQRCGSRGRLIPAWAGKTLSDLRVYRADRSDLGNP